jgi:hypothetical protein
MDSYAIASAIADRFSAANVTPPTGEPEPAVVTADLPESISYFPTLLVFPPRMDGANYNASRNRSFPLIYSVALFLSRSDGSPRRAKRVHDWVTALYGQLGGQLQLGLSSYVALATVDDFYAGPIGYEGIDYDGVAFSVNVRISESYSPVA